MSDFCICYDFVNANCNNIIQKCKDYNIPITNINFIKTILDHASNIGGFIEDNIKYLTHEQKLDILEFCCVKSNEKDFDIIFKSINLYTDLCMTNACRNKQEHVIKKFISLKKLPTYDDIYLMIHHHSDSNLCDILEIIMCNGLKINRELIAFLINYNIRLDFEQFIFDDWNGVGFISSLFNCKIYENQLLKHVKNYDLVRKIYLNHECSNIIEELKSVNDNDSLKMMINYAFHNNKIIYQNLVNRVVPSVSVFMMDDQIFKYFKSIDFINH